MARILPFEQHLDDYENWFVKNHWAYQSEIRAIRELLPAGLGVEIGVGSGLFAQPLGIRFGVEPSPRMMRLARKRGIKVVRGIAEQLPLKQASFDVALMVTTVCFLDDVPAAFAETARVLKPDGSFLVGFIDRESPLGREYQKFKAQNVFYRHADFYSVRELLAFLREAGFTRFDFRQTIFSPLPDIRQEEPVRPGFGQGSFVVIKALFHEEEQS